MSCCCCRVCSCRCEALCTCCSRGGAATAPAGCPCCWRLSSCCWAPGLLLLPQLSVRLFAVVVAVYLTLLVTVEAVNAILYGRMRRWGAFFPAMAAAAGGTGLFVLIVFVPALRDAALRYTAALLLTVFGTGLVCDVLALTIRSRRVRRVLGSIRVALPDLMSLFLPQRTADVLPRAPLGPVPQQGTEEFELLFQTSAHGIAWSATASSALTAGR